MSITQSEIDDFLHREWNNARADRASAEMLRLSMRACDKVLAEMELRGFTGFAVTRDAAGRIEIVGTPSSGPNYGRAP